MSIDHAAANRTRVLVDELRVLVDAMRETVLESRALTSHMRVRKVLCDAAREKVLLSMPLDPAEGVVDGLVYASEYSAAFGDPVITDLIRTALRLVGLRLGLECGPKSDGQSLH